MINLTIDGVQIEAKEGQSILSAAREHGIHIPTLCFLEKINEIGSCRICPHGLMELLLFGIPCCQVTVNLLQINAFQHDIRPFPRRF